jgi:hypothetical protein
MTENIDEKTGNISLKCVICGKKDEECRDFVGCICLDCFMKVGSEVCCICGKKLDGIAKEYVDYGITKRNGVVDTFHGLLCDECAFWMVKCKVCGCFVPLEVAVDYKELGTGMATGEKLCYECYVNNFVECSKCGGLVPKNLENIKWNKKGKIICLVCAEELEKS